MAIAAVFEFPSEPVEKYHKVFEAGDAIVDQPDRMYHVCYRTGTGFTVVDIWADEQSFAAFGETLGPAIQRAGLDAKPAVYPVEQIVAQDGLRFPDPAAAVKGEVPGVHGTRQPSSVTGADHDEGPRAGDASRTGVSLVTGALHDRRST
jgi:hypothetical protein